MHFPLPCKICSASSYDFIIPPVCNTVGYSHHLVRPSVRPSVRLSVNISFPGHNSETIPPRKLKFGMNVAHMVQMCLLGV